MQSVQEKKQRTLHLLRNLCSPFTEACKEDFQVLLLIIMRTNSVQLQELLASINPVRLLHVLNSEF